MTDEARSQLSPYHQWDRDSPGWLHRCVAEESEILPEDVIRVLEKNPDLLADDLVRDLVIRGLRGRLLGKRGRKAIDPMTVWNILMRYDELRTELEASKPHGRRRGLAPAAHGPEPMQRIHAIIAKEFKLGGRENVRNLISRLKSGKNLHVNRSAR